MTQKLLENEGDTPLGTLFRPYKRDEGNLGKVRLQVPRAKPHQHDQLDCLLLSLKTSNEQVERLWIKMRHQANKGHLMVDLYYRPSNQEEDVTRAFLLQLQEAFCWTTSVTLTSIGKAEQ